MILPGGGDWDTRRAQVEGTGLARLADSLAGDLDRLLPDEDFLVPAEKAMLTRRGGRCDRDGQLLEFDPRSPHRHLCPACGATYDRDEDHLWWIMGYQLWLSERAVHAALLARLRGTERHRRLAAAILTRYADRYLSYPNVDNVLGPGRVFFSTYLESIWLLQLCVALSLLDEGSLDTGAVMDRLIAPSAELVGLFNEGASNRQIWNSAALAAAGRILGSTRLVDRAITGPGGLHAHLRSGLLPDGSWYEGENYHLFAHRGLWYLVAIAEAAGYSMPDELGDRFDRAFAVPLLTALPDLTFPSRRDSQYRVSLRQWRFAESLELGLARGPDHAILASGLQRLYAAGPDGDTERWRSTGEAERNAPGSRLTRSDLGWKSLWRALPQVPDAPAVSLGSVLLPDQGLAVVRRNSGAVYVALDYGHSGGGHGHPDRLNLWLVNGDDRILEDVGTGSYVDPSLHWYRSTLAHNAPLVDGRRQDPGDGVLHSWAESGGFTLVDAGAEPAHDVPIRRRIVVGPEYLIDAIEWSASREVTIDVPLHAGGVLDGVTWVSRDFPRTEPCDDGFQFVRNPEWAGAVPRATITANGARAIVHAPVGHEWWRFIAPGPPGQGDRQFLLLRCGGRSGRILVLWDWSALVEGIEVDGDAVRVIRSKGAPDVHRVLPQGWTIDPAGGPATELAGGVAGRVRSHPVESRGLAEQRIRVIAEAPRRPGMLGDGEAATAADESLRFRLAGESYHRSEQSWQEAGAPEAVVTVAASRHELLIEVAVFKENPVFVPHAVWNPLDNEHPDTNSDGVQLAVTPWESPADRGSWILVPEDGGRVRVTSRGSDAMPITATWRLTSRGYQVLARVGLDALRVLPDGVDLGLIVNEKPAGRARRRGQLVLGATRGGWTWLRGDRHDPAHLLPVRIDRG